MPHPTDVQEIWTRHLMAALERAGVDWQQMCAEASQGCAEELGITIERVQTLMEAFHAPLDYTGHA